MSTDRFALAALEQRAQASLRYFEQVEVHLCEAERHICYMCVGDHALLMVSRSLAEVLEGFGELRYEHLAGVVQDTISTNALLLVLNDGASDAFVSRSIVVIAEHRNRLLAHLRCAWQTSHLWRTRSVEEMKVKVSEIGAATSAYSASGWRRPPRLAVQAYHGYQTFAHDGFTMFLKQDFRDIGDSMHSSCAGMYVTSLGLTCTLQIQDPRPLSELERCGGDQHIRWVATRQRQSLEESSSHLVVRSAFYQKKMNLVNDIASWTGWEMLIKSDTEVRVMISLRRQYLPPLADSAQDIFVTLFCPKHVLDNKRGLSDEAILAEARLAADSLAPMVQCCTAQQALYRDIIQAKLDALLFNEDSMTWLARAVGLSPHHTLEHRARIFVKSLLKILQEESALRTPDLLLDVGDVPTEKEPITVPFSMFPVGQQHHLGQDEYNGNDAVMNAWLFRVARYLAWCLDGGLCGPRLSLMDLTSVYISTAQSQEKVDEVIMFLLHIRSKDFTQPFRKMTIRYLVNDPTLFESHTFNDRVMQSLVELGWFMEALQRRGGQKDADRLQESRVGYATLLASLLRCSSASINLRAAVCRQIVAHAESVGQKFGVLCPALMELVLQPIIFLRMYATLTLVTLAGRYQEVQNMIMDMGIISACITNLKSGEDDLIRYTLALLTLLTKNIGRVKAIEESGMTDVVMMLLEKTPSLPSKQAVLVELASVVGQLCNDIDVWKAMQNHPCRPADKLIVLYNSGASGGRIRSKALFALRMFIEKPSAHGQSVQEAVVQLVDSIIKDLDSGLREEIAGNPDRFDLDFAANAVLMLSTLSKNQTALKAIIAVPEAVDVIHKLTFARIGGVDSTRDRLQKLDKRVSEGKDSRYHRGKR